MATPNSPYDLSNLIETISGQLPPVSVNYLRLCFLLDVLVLPSASKIPLKNGSSFSTIYHDTFKDKNGGCARLWYALKMIQGCSSDQLEKLKTYIKKPYTLPALPLVHLRVMLLQIASEIETEDAPKLINIAGSTFNPQVSVYSLDPGNTGKDYTYALFKFFKKAEEQLQVEPDNLDNLRKWLNDLGYQRLIKNYLDNFNSEEEIKILGEFSLFSL